MHSLEQCAGGVEHGFLPVPSMALLGPLDLIISRLTIKEHILTMPIYIDHLAHMVKLFLVS